MSESRSTIFRTGGYGAGLLLGVCTGLQVASWQWRWRGQLASGQPFG